MQLNSKTVLFQTIHSSISMHFSSIWPIDRALSGATTPGQSGSGSDSNEGVLCIPQSSSITGTSPSDCLVSYQDTHWESLTPQQRSSWCILQPQPTEQTKLSVQVTNNNITKSAGDVEHTNYISVEGVRLPPYNDYPRYDSKPYNDKAPVIELWQM